MNIFKQIESNALFDMEITCVLDGFEPRLAPLVLEVISEQSEETLQVMMAVACDEAWRETGWN